MQVVHGYRIDIRKLHMPFYTDQDEASQLQQLQHEHVASEED